MESRPVPQQRFAASALLSLFSLTGLVWGVMLARRAGVTVAAAVSLPVSGTLAVGWLYMWGVVHGLGECIVNWIQTRSGHDIRPSPPVTWNITVRFSRTL